jgi:hypothetical protein
VLRVAIRFGGAVGIAALRPAASTVSTGLRWERAARDTVARRLGDGALSALDALLASTVAQEAVDRTLASGLMRRALDRALEGPLVDRVAEDLARYAVIDRVIDRLLADGSADDAAAWLVAREELWTLVEAIVGSPAVTDAITRQGAGFADQVAGGMRVRSRKADARLENAARRALRRTPP